MSKVFLELEITQDDIDKSEGSCTDCALALAVNRKLHLTGSVKFRSYSSVLYTGIFIMKSNISRSEFWLHTTESMAFVMAIDENKSLVKPCKLKIYKEFSDDTNQKRVA